MIVIKVLERYVHRYGIVIADLHHLTFVPSRHHRSSERSDASLLHRVGSVDDEFWGEFSLDTESLTARTGA